MRLLSGAGGLPEVRGRASGTGWRLGRISAGTTSEGGDVVNERSEMECLAYVEDALRRQAVRYRNNAWMTPTGILNLLEMVGFRVSRGQDGSSGDGRSEIEERVDQGPTLLVKYKTAAQLLDVSESTVKRLIKAGELHPVSIGGASRLRRTELEAFVAALQSDGGN